MIGFDKFGGTGLTSLMALAIATLPAAAQAQSGPGQVPQPGPGSTSSATGSQAVPSEAQNVPAESNLPGDADARSDAPASGEIVVTAQKRTERLVQVPLAVTAVSGDALASQQINDTASLARAIPSLSFQAGNNPSNSSFRIRGVGTQLFGAGTESAVAIVVDGVVAARQSQGFSDLADLERVEVLRGPQGTLFGKNATAGVINVVTARPSSTFGGRVDATVAEKGEYRVKGTVTGPLSETLRARLTGYYNDVGGHLYNVAKDKDTNGFTSWGVRGKLDWDAAPNLNMLASLEYRKSNADCCSRVPISITTPALATLLGPQVVATPHNRNVSNDDASYTRQKSVVASLQGDWDLGAATVTSISAFQRYKQNDQFEPDQIFSDPVRYVGASAYSQWNQNASLLSYKNYSQELRLGSNGTRDLTYVIGGFYAHLDLSRALQRRRARCPSGTIGAVCTSTQTFDSSGFNGVFRSDNAALFGQVDYRAIGGLHLIAGLRGQYEAQTVTGTVYAPLVTGDAIFPGTKPNTGTSKRHGSAVTGKAGVRYEFNRNLQTYATYTRGYKAFALDIDANTDYVNNTGLNPERVNAYEAGIKWQAPGGVFDINAALFRSDFTNLQVQAIQSDSATGVFQSVNINAGKSRSQGVELEATMHPSRNFSVAANFTLLDATIDVDGQTCPLQLQSAATVYTANYPVNMCYLRRTTTNGVTTTSSAIIDVRGGVLPATPRYRVGITPRYEQEFGNLAAFIQVGLNYQSKTSFSLSQDPLLRQQGYTLIDASIGLHDIDQRYNLTLFVKNLTNQTYFSQLNHGTILATATAATDVWANVNKDANRYFGASFGVRF